MNEKFIKLLRKKIYGDLNPAYVKREYVMLKKGTIGNRPGSLRYKYQQAKKVV